jgi:ferritin
MNRKLKLVSEEIGNLLVKQLSHEQKNANLYYSFANYFSLEGIVALETYYRKRAKEEQNHHDWIETYLSAGDFRIIYPIVEVNPEQEVKSLIEPFISTVEREIQTTQMLYAIYELAISQKDYMTASWLFEKLIKEQIEEENTSRMARVIMEMDGDIFIKASEVLKLLNA